MGSGRLGKGGAARQFPDVITGPCTRGTRGRDIASFSGEASARHHRRCSCKEALLRAAHFFTRPDGERGCIPLNHGTATGSGREPTDDGDLDG